MSIYACHRQLHPPTSVVHAIWCNLSRPRNPQGGCQFKDLVIARRSSLEVYAVVDGSILEMVGSFPVCGIISALHAIPVGSISHLRPDLLAVTMEPARLSLLAFDAVLSRLTTLSIHNLEEDSVGPGSGMPQTSFGLSGGTVNKPPTLTAVDPEGRCIACVVAGSKLVLLPVIQRIPSSAYISPEGRSILMKRKKYCNRGVGNDTMEDADATTEKGRGHWNGTTTSPIAHDSAWTEGIGSAKVVWVRWVTHKPLVYDLEDVGISGLVRSICFLEGLSKPALAILFEKSCTWAGRLAAKRNTCNVVVLSLIMSQGRTAAIWNISGLPHDATSITATPKPLGGLVALCNNSALYMNQNMVLACVGVNGFSPATVSKSLPLHPNEGDYGWASLAQLGGPEIFDLAGCGGGKDGTCIELGHCSSAFLAPDAILLALQSGNAVVLRLHQSETTGLVDALTVRLVGTCPPSTTLASFNTRGGCEYSSQFPFESSDGLAFLGSMLGDSLLMKWNIYRRDQNIEAEDYTGLQRFIKKEELLGWEMATCEREASAKLRLVNNGDTPTTLDQAEASKQIKMEDDAIYGREAEELRVEEKLGGDERQNEKEYKVEALGLQLRVTDTLFNIGPIANIQVSPVSSMSIPELEKPEVEPAIVCCSGFADSGGITVVSAGLRMWEIAEATIPDLQAVWSLGNMGILLSGTDWTKLMQFTDEGDLEEVLGKDADFVMEVSTIDAAPLGMSSSNIIIQVHEQGIRMIKNGTALQDMMLLEDQEIGGIGIQEGNDCTIRQACVCSRYVLLLLSGGTIRLLALDNDDETDTGDDELQVSRWSLDNDDVVGSEWAVTTASLTAFPERLFPSPSKVSLLGTCTPYDESMQYVMEETNVDMSPFTEEDLLLYGERLFGTAAPSGGLSKEGPRAVPSHAWDKVCSDLGMNMEVDLPQKRDDDTCGGGVVYCTICHQNGRMEILEVTGEGTSATMHRVFLSNSAISGGAMVAWDDRCCSIDNEKETNNNSKNDHITSASGDAVVPPDPIIDIILHRTGAVGAPPALQRLALCIRLQSGDLMVYEARFGRYSTATCPSESECLSGGTGTVQESVAVACFLRIGHDFIGRSLLGEKDSNLHTTSGRGHSTRPFAVRGATAFSAEGNHLPLRGRSLLAFSDCAGHSAIVAFGTNSKSAMILSERGALCVCGIRGSVGLGVSCIAAMPAQLAGNSMPVGGFVAVSSLRGLLVLSADPMAGQMVCPGVAGGGVASGGGQGCFVAQRLPVGRTVSKCVHVRFPSQGRKGILASMLETPTFATLLAMQYDVSVSAKKRAAEASASSMSEETMVPVMNENAAEEVALDESWGEEGEGTVIQKHRDFVQPDESYGGAPPLMDLKWQVALFRLAITPKAGGELFASTSMVSCIDLLENEYAMSLDVLILGNSGEERPYIVVGTGWLTSQGEDSMPKGRLLIYEMDYMHVATADGHHVYVPNMREIVSKEVPGALCAVAQVGSRIVVAIAKSVTVYAWDSKAYSIQPIGIHEASQFVVTMSVVKEYILLGDAANGVALLVWRDEDRSLIQLAKDYDPSRVMAAGFIIDPPALCIATCDDTGGLRLMQYMPKAVDSRRGHRLLCVASAKVGTMESVVTALSPVRYHDGKSQAPRYGLIMGSQDGAVACLVPVDERTFRRLAALQVLMTNALEHTAGSNPRTATLQSLSGAYTRGANLSSRKALLDGKLLWRFVSLDRLTQYRLTRAIGTTVGIVLNNLEDIDIQSFR